MKKITIAFLITILSFTTNAEQEMQLIATQTQTAIELILASNESTDTNLWEILDTNKDGFLSKIEASSSQEVYENWDVLDLNKNKKLETEEFALIFSQEN